MDFSKRQGDTVGVYGPSAYQKGIVELRMKRQMFGLDTWSYSFRGIVPKLDSIDRIIVMDSLGIIGRTMPVGPTWNLIGAKIGGKEYGTVLGVVGPEPARPSGCWLAQNYPNPFNPVTTINFQLSAVSQTKLSIFDLIGREVDVLVNEMKEAGTYSVQWDASRFSSGVYFMELQSGGVTTLRKMLLLR
jgi:hypothetical protein